LLTGKTDTGRFTIDSGAGHLARGLKDPNHTSIQQRQISISHRRSDSKDIAGQISDRLGGQPIYMIAARVNAQGVGFSVGKDMLMGIAHAQDKAVDADSDAPIEGDRLAIPRLNLEVLVANDRTKRKC